MIDYLRYVAFQGWLRSFFNDVLYTYVDRGATTGQHLSFEVSPRVTHDGTRSRNRFWYSDGEARYLRIDQQHDLSTLAGTPATFRYIEDQRPRLRILIDVDPEYWHARYDENTSFEGTVVQYRRSGPARGHLSSGDRIVDQAKGKQGCGTLCGVVSARDGRCWGLTCGHVAALNARVCASDQRRDGWRIWLRSLLGRPDLADLGIATHFARPGSHASISAPYSALDASLIEIGTHVPRGRGRIDAGEADIAAISTLSQDDLVQFRGSGRTRDTLARISAITVRKSIDLGSDGEMSYMGDMLMLGHRQPMYIQQPVSRAGDSGAAVRLHKRHPRDERMSWCGMIIGGDQTAAYATYAEHLWGWAMAETGDQEIRFSYEL
ncbi:MAG: hypothetical protein EKK53_25625 [Burkholderiales bacterium]|nr:MAG: hypothetical protein EKK53_25625 [Burkholderiales bacterium]